MPDGDLGLEQEEFGRAPTTGALVDLPDPGIDAIGIGLQRAARRFVLRRDRLRGQTVEIEAAHDLVDAHGALAEDLGQAALGRAAHLRHLPQPVLRMGEAEREEDIVIGRAEDMGHVGVVAHDLDRGRDAVEREVFGVVRQRARQEIIEYHQRKKPRTTRPANRRRSQRKATIMAVPNPVLDGRSEAVT